MKQIKSFEKNKLFSSNLFISGILFLNAFVMLIYLSGCNKSAEIPEALTNDVWYENKGTFLRFEQKENEAFVYTGSIDYDQGDSTVAWLNPKKLYKMKDDYMYYLRDDKKEFKHMGNKNKVIIHLESNDQIIVKGLYWKHQGEGFYKTSDGSIKPTKIVSTPRETIFIRKKDMN